MNLGEKLKKVRKAAKLTQGDMAEKLAKNRANVGSWEENRGTPSYPDLAKIISIFSINPDWLLLDQGPMLRPAPPPKAAQEAPPAPAASAPQAAPPPKAAQAAPPPKAAQAAPPPKAAQAAPHSQVDAIEENFHLSQIDTAVREPDLHNYGKGDHLGPLMRLDNPEITKLTEELLVALRETKEAHRETKEAYKKIAELEAREVERLRKDKG